jgi:hypothetical protein
VPYLLRLPLPGRPVVLKARETWPRTSKVYCHRADSWPESPVVVERVAVKSCTGFVADLLARVQVRWPSVPVFFAETRPLAEEWTYRFLAAAAAESVADARVGQRLSALVSPGPLACAPAIPAQVRAWALEQGLPVSDRGRVRADVLAAYAQAHPSGVELPP